MKVQEKAVFIVAMLVGIERGIIRIPCVIKWISGISCPGCGMMRAVRLALKFQFAEAFYFHPLFWMMPFCALLFLFRQKVPPKIEKCSLWIVIVCFFGIYVIRLLYSDHVVVAVTPEQGLAIRIINKILRWK